MKRIFLIVILTCVFLVPVFSIENITLNPLKFNGVTFKIGNDRWTHGLYFNYDDNLTYSLGLDVDFSTFKIESDLQAFTDKYQGSRYDLLNLYVSVPINMEDYLTIVPKIGFYSYGNLGLQDLQNRFHKIIGIYQLNLSYPRAPYSNFLVGLDTYTKVSIGPFDFGPYVNFDYKIWYAAQADIGFMLAYDTLTANLSYRLYNGYQFTNDNYMRDVTLLFRLGSTQGLTLGFQIAKGTVDLDLNFNLDSKIGYTTIKISLFKPYINGELKYSFGKIWHPIFRNGSKTIFEEYNTVEVDYSNFFLATQYNTESQIKNKVGVDILVLSAGYSIPMFRNFYIKPSLKFARYTTQSTEVSEYYFGGSIDVQYGFDLFANYRLNFFIGYNYMHNLMNAPSFGFNISLI